MKNLDSIAEELFNKIRGRFPNITVGDDTATITNKPGEARFFEFDFASGKKVSVNIDQDALTVMYATDLFSEDETILKDKWFDLLKELRVFAKKRMLNFDTRDITKSNLDKRDYEYLSTEKQMSESKMYGTSRTSYQDIGSARLVVKHAGPVNHENAAGRTQNVHSIYIESADGERFKYPLRHMNGARAMAMHVSEGGNAYDDFGKHIVGLSEELNKLRKFKTYMNRSSVMAEGLAGYMDVVNERLATVKKTVESLQRKTYYKEAFENFETTVLEEVPEDVSNTWIDELTIRQFNEELKGVFPYVYNLVKEANKVEEVDLDSVVEDCMTPMEAEQYHCKDCGDTMHNPTTDCPHDVHDENGRHWVDENGNGVHDADEGVIDPQTAYAEKLDSIISSAKHEQDPNEAYANAFEDFKMAAANAAAKGEKDFEYPAGSGKKHPVKMDKGTAAKLLADDIQTNEDELKEWFWLLPMAATAAGTAARVAGPRLLTGAKELLKWSAKNPVKATVGGVAVTNPSDTADVVGGAVDAVQGVGSAMSGAGDAIDSIKQNVAAAGEKVISTADDLKAMAGGALDKIPNLNGAAAIAKQYALPAALVMAILFGGYKAYKALFGDKEDDKAKEDDKDATTIDISPKGNGDELKQKNEIPIEEFVKSMYDYTTNGFPKGETAVLTAVQKQYGDEMVDEAQSVMAELLKGQDDEMARIQALAGLR